MAFKGGKTIYDLSDKTFSIVKASSGGSTDGGSTGGGSTGGGTGGGNEGGGNKDDGTQGGGKEGDGKGNDPALPDTDMGDAGGGKEGGGQGNDPTVPTFSILSPQSGDVLTYGQDVRLSFSIEDGAGYNFCFLWSVGGPGTKTRFGAVGPIAGAAHAEVRGARRLTLPATGDYNEFRTVLYGYPTGPGSSCEAGLNNGDFVVTPSVEVAVAAQPESGTTYSIVPVDTRWWASSPEVTLNSKSTVSVSLTFKNNSGVTASFAGGTDSPPIQVWSVPGGESLPGWPMIFTSVPAGDYANGETFTYAFSFDPSSLSSSEKGIAVRPVDNNLLGTMRPNQISLESYSIEIN